MNLWILRSPHLLNNCAPAVIKPYKVVILYGTNLSRDSVWEQRTIVIYSGWFVQCHWQWAWQRLHYTTFARGGLKIQWFDHTDLLNNSQEACVTPQLWNNQKEHCILFILDGNVTKVTTASLMKIESILFYLLPLDLKSFLKTQPRTSFKIHAFLWCMLTGNNL